MEVEFNNVSVCLNRRTPLEKVILKHVSFKLLSGGKYTFLGKSGSGKTVIGEVINATVKPSSGFARIGEFVNDGSNIKDVNKLRFDVGVVYKNKEDMFFNKTVKSELLFGMKYFKYKTNNKTMRAKEALKIVGLNEEYLNKKIDELSLSEAKKVGIASVLVFNPKVLILDEPTLHLNYKEKDELIRILNFINEKYKKTIILLSRDVDFVYQFKSKVFIMYNGKLMESGENEILTDKAMLNKYSLSLPSVVEFSIKARECGANIRDYVDIKDLIKGVCNDVL